MGQPRRQNPARVTGISGGRGDREASQSLGMKRRDLPLLRWRPTEGPSVSTMRSAAERSPRRAHLGAVVEVPGVQGKSGNLSLDTLDDGVESQGKLQRAQSVPLLHPAAAANGVRTQVEEGLAPIAGFHPSRESGKAATELHKHGLTANVVEGISEIQQEGHNLYCAYENPRDMGCRLDHAVCAYV